jgi:hypothetical protein
VTFWLVAYYDKMVCLRGHYTETRQEILDRINIWDTLYILINTILISLSGIKLATFWLVAYYNKMVCLRGHSTEKRQEILDRINI